MVPAQECSCAGKQLLVSSQPTMAKNPVQLLVKHVGRGKTLAKDLTSDQAREALERLLGGEFTPSQTGAFLQALRIKETTADELVGAALGGGAVQVPTNLPPESSPLVG